MTDTTEQKALALVNEVRRERGFDPDHYLDRDVVVVEEALCRAIEQHEAFRQEVSDAVEACRAMWPGSWDLFHGKLTPLIIAKPDPLVEALAEAYNNDSDEIDAAKVRAAIEKRGGKIVWGEG